MLIMCQPRPSCRQVFPPSAAVKPISYTGLHKAYVRTMEEENRLQALQDEERRMAESAKAANVGAFK